MKILRKVLFVIASILTKRQRKRDFKEFSDIMSEIISMSENKEPVSEKQELFQNFLFAETMGKLYPHLNDKGDIDPQKLSPEFFKTGKIVQIAIEATMKKLREDKKLVDL